MTGRSTLAVFEYHLSGYRRVWRGTVFSSFVMPVLFFLGMGLMVGEYVDRGGALDLPYAQFIGAGLLAFTGVQVAMIESGFPVLGNFKWHKIYYGMAAAPPRVSDMIAGQLGYISLRVLVTATAFLLVMIPFGAVASAGAVFAPLIAVLVGLAVAAPMFAYSATIDSPNLMAIMFRFAQLPMMLFSGVFFPIEQLPGGLQPLAYALPLYHGVELCRAVVLGAAYAGSAWPIAAHLGYLLLWVVAGFALATVRFRTRLAR
ncbi:ABC transporter permease [Natronosporangium hydrolyticum]|uniref:Transport permease protein n=1 Tax=Natronosporangium hydrolyticum TaxID=2811111 RepID=A0A895Y614_9ACTN|nr:ABC transporter permease [Natronosporangium hydrolyticum]QSB13164.1 ABC transporter permease [Natronosporangium hydrolyticum]